LKKHRSTCSSFGICDVALIQGLHFFKGGVHFKNPCQKSHNNNNDNDNDDDDNDDDDDDDDDNDNNNYSLFPTNIPLAM